jgi:hypothetical protein
MTERQWFDMLAEDQNQEEKTYIHELWIGSRFTFDGEVYEPGTYYVRDSLESIEELREALKKAKKLRGETCRVRKLSFSELLYFSERFASSLAQLIPSAEEVKEWVATGQASRSFDELAELPPLIGGLKRMRDAVRVKYFNGGWRSVVRSCFSAIANFFLKYNLYAETGIYWPGNSCSWANKIIHQINQVNRAFALAVKANQQLLSECLEIPLEELLQMEKKEVKKRWQKKALETHPDKFPAKVEEFKKIKSVYRDFEELAKLREKFDWDELDLSKLSLIDLNGQIAKDKALTSRRVSQLALPASTH